MDRKYDCSLVDLYNYRYILEGIMNLRFYLIIFVHIQFPCRRKFDVSLGYETSQNKISIISIKQY